MTWLIPLVLLVFIAIARSRSLVWCPTGPLIPKPFNLVTGIPAVLAGPGLAASDARRFRDVGTNIHTFRTPEVLVEDGLFAISRNPLYPGFSLALLGIAIKLGEPLVIMLAAAFVLIADRGYMPFEESRVRARFGSTWSHTADGPGDGFETCHAPELTRRPSARECWKRPSSSSGYTARAK